MKFSIIIPTYNQCNILKLTLNAYLGQTLLDHIKEIIIVDDGSTDDTRSVIKDFSKKSPIQILYFYQEKKESAQASNKGIYAASGDILLLTADDVIPDPRMVEEHYLTHKKHDFNPNISCLGKTIWPKDKKVTPFMAYVQEMGLQYGYSLITDENNVQFNFFYTTNISIQRNFLLEGKLFDTDFPYAVWEDIELGYRLKKRGLQIIYNKNAIGYHHHDIFFTSFRKRQELCGQTAHIFYNKHPELIDFLGLNSSRSQNPIVQINVKLVEMFCLFAEKYLPMSFPRSYDLVMGYYYNKGVVNYNDPSKNSEPMFKNIISRFCPNIKKASNYGDTKKSTDKYWSNAFAKGGIKTWMSEIDVRYYINENISGSPDEWSMDWFKRVFVTKPYDLGLSIGCGDGSLEREVRRKDICKRIVGTDISQKALEIAKLKAKNENIEGIDYQKIDFNTFILPKNQYDICFFHQSMHHVLNLEHCLSQIKNTIKPQSYIYIDEYMGPSRTGWDDSKLKLANSIYNTLPGDIKIYNNIPIPIEINDPSEAIRSSEIFKIIDMNFEIIEKKDYGGNILSLIYPCIRWNILSENTKKEILGFLINEEKNILKSGVSSYYSIIIAKNRE